MQKSVDIPISVKECFVSIVEKFLLRHASALGGNTPGIAVRDEGELGAAEIDARRLIDTHYGAIASKAMATAPADLNPTAAARALFASTFGAGSWEQAVAAGKVYNAVSACEHLGIDAASSSSTQRASIAVTGAP